jgi:hypothetical protein
MLLTLVAGLALATPAHALLAAEITKARVHILMLEVADERGTDS